VVLKQFGISLLDMTRGDVHMIIFKITAICMFAAGTLVALLTTELGPDLALIVLARL
jgi:hypothetical protein